MLQGMRQLKPLPHKLLQPKLHQLKLPIPILSVKTRALMYKETSAIRVVILATKVATLATTEAISVIKEVTSVIKEAIMVIMEVI